MSAVLSSAPDAAAPPAAASDQALACFAAFFDKQDEAAYTALLLPRAVGVLLGPGDGGRLVWALRRRRWARRPNDEGQAWFDYAGLTVVIGASLAGLLALSWLLGIGDIGGPEHTATVIGVAILCGGLLGWTLTMFAPQQRHQRRFDAMVRQHLMSGGWALVAHDLPAAQRAEVLALLREHCVSWCSVAAAERWV
jgi:hypothetical protein